MNSNNDKTGIIKGWGVDAAETVSPRESIQVQENDGFSIAANLKRQETNREILHSNERPNITAVFGTTLPPSGLSGVLRRFAFRYSESNWMHWLSLLLADRVNVAEGLADDIRRGRLPNIPKEKGWNARWRHERKKTITRLACGAGALLLAAMYLKSRKAGKKK